MMESPGQGPYQVVNDHLVEIFQRLLSIAATLTAPPVASWTEEVLGSMVDELTQTLAQIKPGGPEKHVGARSTC
jgi:hypothetical protein